MTAARRRALLLLLTAVAIVCALALFAARPSPPPAPAEKPRLLLLTSLPLVFGEGFGLEVGGSPAFKALSERFTVLPISTTAPAELRKGPLLLMAHPPAQTAENLVALDQWVRDGGHVLLLADPLLEWPSERPLGDPLRPPPMFMDTGLLKHWGLRLQSAEQRGRQMRRLAGREVMTASSGSLSGCCEVSADRLTAQCRIGRGRATIVADADLLDVEHLDGPTENNLEALLAELANLSAR
jgi:hypothetical protein